MQLAAEDAYLTGKGRGKGLEGSQVHELLVYEALSHLCMRPYATSV